MEDDLGYMKDLYDVVRFDDIDILSTNFKGRLSKI